MFRRESVTILCGLGFRSRNGWTKETRRDATVRTLRVFGCGADAVESVGEMLELFETEEPLEGRILDHKDFFGCGLLPGSLV